MRGDDFFLDWALPIAGSLLLIPLVLAQGRGIQRVSPAWRTAGWTFYVLSRLVLPWWVNEVHAYMGPSDYRWWYILHVEPVMGGLRPGVDFANAYGPLFPYLQAVGSVVLPCFRHLGVLIPFVLGDFVTLLLVKNLTCTLRSSAAGNWIQAWILASPLQWHLLSVRGQDEVLFGAFLAGFLLVERSASRRLAPLLMGLGFCATKITFAPIAFSMLLTKAGPRQRLRFALWASLPVAIAYGGTYAIGGNPFSWEWWGRSENLDGVSGIDGLARCVPGIRGMVKISLAAAAMFSGVLLVGRRVERFPLSERPLRLLIAAHAIFMLTMPSALPTYAIQGQVPLLVALAIARPSPMARWMTAGLALVSLSVSLWWTGSVWFGGWAHIAILGGFHVGILLWVLDLLISDPMRVVAAPEDPAKAGVAA